MFQIETFGGGLMKSILERRQYVLQVWFVYRYFCQNPKALINPCYKEFYEILDKYFMEKYKLSTPEETRQGIEQLFNYESEKPIIINDHSISHLIEQYKQEPFLLRLF